ncbi:hypothetical protein J2S13_002920 [Oikeobacillus pervagus]|uniref:LiaI-LiaF-like transmembrane region domain-containing protein n=1 Tax=Oikeobacillus pervagus TaxID=1325931 RepID=A0AAJ1T4H2_9BACI|nr:DUF5668 domain-containing protein [Oikeobacillus pervagus]MDQ0216461.1 hypothetical protein [Oikeobacillus pervagus]
MKHKRIFPGIILIGFGFYFFLQKSNIQVFQDFFTWPTLLAIVGIAFLGQAYSERDDSSILPGVILTGFGVHFHLVNLLEQWPNDIGVFIFIIALGLLLQNRRNGSGLFPGLLFLILAIISLFYEKITEWFGLLENNAEMIWSLWPIMLVLVGAYLLFMKKK